MRSLVADCVGKRYGARWVLRSATLRAVPGQLRGLIGRNGSGKSTLMKIAAGILAADTGVVLVDGVGELRPRLHRLAARGLFYLPDRDLSLGGLTVREHLRVAAETYGRAPIATAVDSLGLESLLARRPWQLSSGERRRMELAIVMARRPSCLLADEPLRNVAPVDAELLLRTLKGLSAGGCAVVMTGHEVPAIFEWVDHISWCTDGTTYELGPPAVARENERFAALYLGSAPGRVPS